MFTLYSNNCPKCKVLKAKLTQKNIQFEEISDLTTVIEKGFMSVPILQADDKFLDFSEAVKYINEIGVVSV